MSKRILSFMLILCMCMGSIPVSTAYATEKQEEVIGATVAAYESNESNQVVTGGNLYIPENGSEVHMEDLELPVATYSLRSTVKAPKERYTVLVLDNSSSTSFLNNGSVFYTADTALPYVKAASKKFVEALQKASGDNYVAIVTYGGSSSRVAVPFTDDLTGLTKTIDSISTSGGTRSVYRGLTAAETLIDSIENEAAIKNVVLFSTGMTNDGPSSTTGKYSSSTVGSRWYRTDTGINLYAYANKAYEASEALKEKSSVYSIGLFNTMEDMPETGRDVVQLFKLCASDWATSQEYFYDVKNPDDLEFVFGQVAQNIVKKTGTFSYPGKGMDYTSTYYYDDNYFKSTSYEYNAHLATMSLCLELSCWGSKDTSDYTQKMQNAEELLTELSFVGFDHNYTDFAEDGILGKPMKNSIGAVAANKLLKFDGEEYTLIAVAVRGGEYEREWAGNFNIGKEGQHKGFSEARDKVIAFIENYIKEQQITGKIKFWITGYSRGAATANMVAGAIDDRNIDLNGCELELKDVFAYTFETPAGAISTEVTDSKYNNIFNIINRTDPVPKVAPKYWKFGRYGQDKFLPSLAMDGEAYSLKKSAMLGSYSGLKGYKDLKDGYLVDSFKMKKVTIHPTKVWKGGDPFVTIEDDKKNVKTQDVFLDEYITMLTKDFLKSREFFVNNLQNGITDACGIFFGTDPAKKDILFEAAKKKFGDNWKELLGIFLNPFKREYETYEKAAEYLEECLAEAGITNYSQEEFAASVSVICDVVLAAAANHPHLTSTLIGNLDGIGQAHYPELCLAWMQSMDTNYTTYAKYGFSTGKYRIVRINCPVDVFVYDEEGSQIGSIINDNPDVDSKVLVAYDGDGEKLVYLPVVRDYTVKIVPTGNDVMHVAIQEFDSYVEEVNHSLYYNDLAISVGQEYVLNLPAYTEEEIADTSGKAVENRYDFSVDGKQIALSEELKDEEVFEAYYFINAVADNEEHGAVTGSGMRQKGTFALLSATPYEGYKFVGWFEGETLLSEEPEFRVRISKDVKYVAVFEERDEDETEGDDPNEGKPEDGSGEDTDDSGREVTGFFRVVSQWDNAFNGEITLTNTSDEVLHNWVIDFDMPHEIVQIWNGEVSSYKDGTYTVKNAGYNWDINPGESVTFGFIANLDSETVVQPEKYYLVNVPNKVEGGYQVTYKVNSDWETAYNGQIEVTNVTAENMLDWVLEFDYENTISQFWNAEIVSHEQNHYVIKNKGHNATIYGGQTMVLGFEAVGDKVDSGVEPKNYKLVSADMK